MTSRSSFEETARYWTHIYAGGPEPGSVSSGKGKGTGKAMDEVAMAGLEHAEVQRFEGLGFAKDKVVRIAVL